MDNNYEEDKPPSHKIAIAGDMDTGSTSLSPNDIKSERRMDFWDRFTQPLFYPAGSSVCTRCIGFHIFIRQ